MKNKYIIKSNDVKQFLKEMGYDWNGKVYTYVDEKNEYVQVKPIFNNEPLFYEIEDFKNNFGLLKLEVSPDAFAIIHYNPVTQQDLPKDYSHSAAWVLHQFINNKDTYGPYIKDFAKNTLKEVERDKFNMTVVEYNFRVNYLKNIINLTKENQDYFASEYINN